MEQISQNAKKNNKDGRGGEGGERKRLELSLRQLRGRKTWYREESKVARAEYKAHCNKRTVKRENLEKNWVKRQAICKERLLTSNYTYQPGLSTASRHRQPRIHLAAIPELFRLQTQSSPPTKPFFQRGSVTEGSDSETGKMNLHGRQAGKKKRLKEVSR